MRVSTNNQEQEQTIKNQRMELDSHLEKLGYVVSPELVYADDGYTGAVLARPELDRLRNDAANGKFDELYAYDRGRLARVFYLQELVINELNKLGIKYYGLHDINGDSPSDKLMGGVFGLFHEYERVKIAERMRLGKMRKVKSDKKILGYNPKFGYDYIHKIGKGPNARDGKLVVNEEQASIVIMIFELYASGMSKHEIQRILFDNKVLPLKAKRTVWSTNVIHRILTDSTYIGIHYYNKTQAIPAKKTRNPEAYSKTVNNSRKPRPTDEWLPIKVTPIIDEKLFTAVQERLLLNKKTYSRNRKNPYLLAGLVYCECSTSRSGDPGNHGYRYYRCNDRLNQRLLTRKCYEKGVNVSILDEIVWSNIKELLLQPELVLEHAKKWQADASPVEKQINQLSNLISKYDEKELRLTKMYSEGVMKDFLYKDEVAIINEQRANTLSEIQALQESIKDKPTLPLEELVEGVVKLVQDLDFTKKKVIIEKLVKKVIATKEAATVIGYIPILGSGGNNDTHYNKFNEKEVGLNAKHWHRRPS